MTRKALIASLLVTTALLMPISAQADPLHRYARHWAQAIVDVDVVLSGDPLVQEDRGIYLFLPESEEFEVRLFQYTRAHVNTYVYHYHSRTHPTERFVRYYQPEHQAYITIQLPNGPASGK